MTKTKFRRQAEELGIRFVGDYPIVNLPHLQYIKLRDGKVWSSWSRSSGGNKNRLRHKTHRSMLFALVSFEKRFGQKIITDPIIRAAHGMEP